MSWRAVARKDFRDAIRARTLWALSVIFVLLAAGTGLAYASFEELSGPSPTPDALIFFVASTVGTFISIAAILATYKAIAGEREAGTIKLLLALPHTRRDVILGKVLGRGAVLAIPVVGALLAGTIVGSLVLGTVAPLSTVLFALVSLLFVLTYVSLVVGLSAVTASTNRAATLAVGFFFVVEMLWDAVVLGAVFVTNGFTMPGPSTACPDWLFLLQQVPPTSSYMTSLSAVLPNVESGVATQTGFCGGEFGAFFVTPWLGIVALLFWLTVPVIIGFTRFRGADL